MRRASQPCLRSRFDREDADDLEPDSVFGRFEAVAPKPMMSTEQRERAMLHSVPARLASFNLPNIGADGRLD